MAKLEREEAKVPQLVDSLIISLAVGEYLNTIKYYALQLAVTQ